MVDIDMSVSVGSCTSKLAARLITSGNKFMQHLPGALNTNLVYKIDHLHNLINYELA